MEIVKGKKSKPQKVVIYGVEGVGKSSFAAQFPNPLFIDIEDGTHHLDVARFPQPQSWQMLIDEVKHIIKYGLSLGYQTLVIDSADWAERLCEQALCAKNNWDGIEALGWGKGYTYLEEEFARFLELTNRVIECGINVVFTAHAQIQPFEQPDEMGKYDRWTLKLQKKTSALLKEWTDMLLFANYKTIVVNVDGKGAVKGKNKGQGAMRMLFTEHTAAFDAKNRFGLTPEMPLEYDFIKNIIPAMTISDNQPWAGEQKQAITAAAQVSSVPQAPSDVPETEKEIIPDMMAPPDGIPLALWQLMQKDSVQECEVQEVVHERGYYPKNVPIKNYAPDFIEGVLISAWAQVLPLILAKRPF